MFTQTWTKYLPSPISTMSVYTDIVEIEFALLIISTRHFPIMEQARETRSVSQVLPCFHKHSKMEVEMPTLMHLVSISRAVTK